MNNLYQSAIELRYEGLTYREISEKLGNGLSELTLRHYFARDGQLHDTYEEYEDDQNKLRCKEAKTLLRRETIHAARALINTLNRAEEKEDYALILKVAAMILDRSGLRIPKDELGGTEPGDYAEQKETSELIKSIKL